ncbi:MAG TPA: PfkB family carbohydrate kinase [Verrucomicrobiales bacterium]|nr:PfkB family carbohydrate kinase [Verrucomicrobiales bacterium]
MSVLVAGTIAIDDVKTPVAEHRDLLGGSASFAAISASFHAPTRLLGIVGSDFPAEHMDLLRSFGIDISGVEIGDGRTFRWSGEYFDDLNRRETLEVQLNVIEDYRPRLPAAYAEDSHIVLLANMSPVTQMDVLQQCRDPRFVIADTMDLWIDVSRPALEQLLQRIDLLVINDSEAKQFMGANSAVRAGHQLLECGPRFVVVKKGEHGALVFARDGFFACPAFPLLAVADPTGAGDTFVGALAGHLAARRDEPIDLPAICQGVVRGAVLASFNCESFSTRRLQEISERDIEERLRLFRSYTAVP